MTAINFFYPSCSVRFGPPFAVCDLQFTVRIPESSRFTSKMLPIWKFHIIALHIISSNACFFTADKAVIKELLLRNRYELEHEVYQIYVHDYQYDEISESDRVTAPISSSYFLFVIALVAIILAFYVFCFAETQCKGGLQCKMCCVPDKNQKFDSNPESKHLNETKNPKKENRLAGMGSEIV